MILHCTVQNPRSHIQVVNSLRVIECSFPVGGLVSESIGEGFRGAARGFPGDSLRAERIGLGSAAAKSVPRSILYVHAEHDDSQEQVRPVGRKLWVQKRRQVLVNTVYR